MEIAEKIRQATKDELGLTVSIGVSFTKTFAKLGSDMKKPDAITTIARNEYKDKVWPLPASDILYCGPATTAKLAKYGIHTIGELAKTEPAFLKRLLGVNGLALWSYANGLDTSRVMPQDYISPIKSIGHGITCVTDLENEEEVYKVILELSQDVGHRLYVHQLAATGVQIWVRANDLSGEQFQCRLPYKTQVSLEIANAGFELFKRRYKWSTNVRAVTIRAINLVPQSQPEQLSLYSDYALHDRRGQLQLAIEDIRRRFGKKAIYNAILMGDKKMPEDGRDLVRMPGMMYQ